MIDIQVELVSMYDRRAKRLAVTLLVRFKPHAHGSRFHSILLSEPRERVMAIDVRVNSSSEAQEILQKLADAIGPGTSVTIHPMTNGCLQFEHDRDAAVKGYCVHCKTHTHAHYSKEHRRL